MKERLIFHIDVNNAFLSWTACELLKTGNTDIRKQVSVIAGDESKRHGVVLAKSPLAKKYGIVTGESIFNARKKYKNLIIYPPNHELYKQYSDKLIKHLSQYTPHLEQYSIDECFLDMSGMGHFFKNEVEFANNIKDEIKNKFGFTVNIGIGNNKLCAKIASDFEKPDKVHTLYKHEIKTKTKLKEMKINTIYDLAHTKKEKLILEFKSFGNILHEYANGIDDSPVENEKSELKGIGNSITLPKDLEELDDIKLKLLELSEQVGSRIRKDKKYSFVVTLYVKYSDFKTLTHQKKLKNPINTDEEIYENVLILLKEIELKPIRSIGIRLSNLVTEKFEQISLFNSGEDVTDNFENLQYTIDNLKSKYGKDIIKKAIRKD